MATSVSQQPPNASDQFAAPETAPEETLLDVTLARFAEFRAHRCSRLTLCAQLHASSGASPDDLAEFVLRFLDTQSKRVDIKGYLSGMLLTVAQRSVMLVIEAPTKVINLLLREFDQRDRVYSAAVAKQKAIADAARDKNAKPSTAQSMGKPGSTSNAQTAAQIEQPLHVDAESPLICNARVMAMQEEVTHVFRHFSVRHAAASGKAEHDDFSRVDPGNLVFDACMAVLSVGQSLSLTEDPQVAQDCFQRGLVPGQAGGGKGQSLLGKLPASNEYFNALCSCPPLMTVPEYLQEFDTPVHYVLESEKTWPIEPFIKY